MTIRVLVVDDNEDVRQGLRALLETQADMAVVGEAANGRQAVAAALAQRPDVVLLDLVMPGLDGLGALRQLSDRGAAGRAIALTSFAEDERVVEAVRAGAAGYLLKDVTPDELLAAIRAVHAGHGYLQSRVTNALLHEAVERGRLEQELESARQVQASLLPARLPELAGWSMAVRWHPAQQVGGDFYDFPPAARGRLRVLVGDVAGHGLPAALFMALTRSVMRTSLATAPSLADGVARANRLVAADASAGMFVTLVCAELDPASGRLSYVNAGHPGPLVRSPAGEVDSLARTGLPLGLRSSSAFEQQEIEVPPGAAALFYTDGVVESGRELGIQGLAGLLGRLPAGPAEVVLAGLEAAIGPAEDDLTLLVLSREGGP